MKKIILSLGLIGLISTGGATLASAQINYNYNQPALNNCYYTQSYPPTYYGNCSGTGFGYSQNYQNIYRQQPQYQTYGYTHGSWYPGYSSSIIGNFFNNNTNTGYNYNGTGGYYNGNYYNGGYTNTGYGYGGTGYGYGGGYSYPYNSYYGGTTSGCYSYGC